MSKKDLREFDPAKLARVDVATWHAYYNHQFFKLFRLILDVSYGYFGPDIFSTIRSAYYSSVAAIIFRKTKGRETNASNRRTLRYLEKFYRLISDRNVHPFDYKRAAQLELDWWFVDRYPQQSKLTRAMAFAQQRSVFYEVPPAALKEYSEKRAEAMELLADYHHDITYVVDWQNMERLLTESYQALYSGLHE